MRIALAYHVAGRSAGIISGMRRTHGYLTDHPARMGKILRKIHRLGANQSGSCFDDDFTRHSSTDRTHNTDAKSNNVVLRVRIDEKRHHNTDDDSSVIISDINPNRRLYSFGKK